MRIPTYFIVLIILVNFAQAACCEERIELKLRGGISHDALFYKSEGTRAAVLAHQTGATMESWRKFANALADRGVMSVSLSSTTPDDVSAAVDYLKGKQYTDLTFIGASAGGGAVTQAMAAGAFPGLRKVVLLSPAWCAPMTSEEIKKLVILAKGDFYKSRAEDAFKEASEPKTLLAYQGSDHGQGLLSGEHGNIVLNEIFNFLGLKEK